MLPRTLTPELVARLAPRITADGTETATSTTVFTGAPLATLPRSTPDDVAVAFEHARRAQLSWAATDVRERLAVFDRFHSLLLRERDLVCDLIQAETGKARRTAFIELCDPLLVTSHYRRTAAKLLRPRRRKGMFPLATSATEVRTPKGVVGVISPWNFPFALALADTIPALIAGNAVVLKPDSQTALSPLFGADLLYRAGLPDGLLQVVLGDGPVIGTAVVDHADYVAFTGSTRTGRVVGARAGARLVGCSLELGGKNPMIVLDDANLDLAVSGAVNGCYTNAGQLCMHIERLYLHESLYADFTDRFVAATRKLSVGGRYDFTAELGSLTGRNQLKNVTEHVDDARAKGANVLTGGQPRPDLGPFFYEPTVLVGVTPGMTCYDNETFGPVVALYPFRTDDEAVQLANATDYGLNGSVFGGDTARAEAIARRVRAGTVNVNDAYSIAYGSVDAPMGGLGSSGLGRRHGAEGLLKYTESQSIGTQRVQVMEPPRGMSYRTYARVTALLLRVLHRLRIR